MGHNIWFKKYPEAESAFLLDGGLNFRSSRKENHINLHFCFPLHRNNIATTIYFAFKRKGYTKDMYIYILF